MAKKSIIDAITKLYSKLGGNLSDVLGTRSNVNFMGTGKSSEPFLDMDLNICLLYTSPSPRDGLLSRMPSSA